MLNDMFPLEVDDIYTGTGTKNAGSIGNRKENMKEKMQNTHVTVTDQIKVR